MLAIWLEVTRYIASQTVFVVKENKESQTYKYLQISEQACRLFRWKTPCPAAKCWRFSQGLEMLWCPQIA